MQARPHLSVVIPAYNEERRIRESLLKLGEYLRAFPGGSEVVVVDDGSVDRTAAIVEEAARSLEPTTLTLLRNGKNRGKGYSIKHGVLLCSGEYVLLSDADFSTPIAQLPELMRRLEEGGPAMAIGSRGLPGSRVETRQPAWREAMGRTFNRLVRLLTGLPFRDTQCGFKLMRREAVLPLFRAARVERFAYDVEILYLARVAGIAVAEVPVLWRNAPGSKVNALHDSLDMMKDVLMILWRDRRGRYRRLRPGLPDGGRR